jgi:hypothetical protein
MALRVAVVKGCCTSTLPIALLKMAMAWQKQSQANTYMTSLTYQNIMLV